MNVPYTALHFGVYDMSCRLLKPLFKGREDSHMRNFLAGAIGGAVAAAVTTPLDVAKTALQTQEPCMSYV